MIKHVILLCFVFAIALGQLQALTDEEYQAYLSLGSCSSNVEPKKSPVIVTPKSSNTVNPGKSSVIPKTSTTTTNVTPSKSTSTTRVTPSKSGTTTNPSPASSTKKTTNVVPSNSGTKTTVTPAKSTGSSTTPTPATSTKKTNTVTPTKSGTTSVTPSKSTTIVTSTPATPSSSTKTTTTSTPALPASSTKKTTTATPAKPASSSKTTTTTTKPATSTRVVPKPSKEGYTTTSQCPVCNIKYYKRFCKKKKTGSTTTSGAGTTSGAKPTASPTSASTPAAAAPASDITTENPRPISDAVKGVLISIVVAAGVAVASVACFAVLLVGTVVYLKNRRRDFFSIYDNAQSSKFKDLVESEKMMQGEISDDEDGTEHDGEDDVEEAANEEKYNDDSAIHNRLTSMLSDASDHIEKLEEEKEQFEQVKPTTTQEDAEFEEEYAD